MSGACMLILGTWAMDTALGLLMGQDVTMTGAVFAGAFAVAAAASIRRKRL